MVFGGFVMCIDAIAVWAMLHNGTLLGTAITLAIFAGAAWLATLGYRRVA
jgi:hypothetical protein